MKRPYSTPTIKTVDMKAEAIAQQSCTCSGGTEESAIGNFTSNWSG